MKERLGFIGVGNMGGRMARYMMSKGYAVTAYDTSAACMQRMVKAGAKGAASPREVADDAEIVIACLPSFAACLEVALGENGIAGGKAARIYVESSTIGPAAVIELAEKLEQHRIAVLDAPISGGTQGAEDGTLTSIVSGANETVQEVRSVLSDLARNIFVVGDRPGLAQACKLVNNALSLTAMMLTSEALVAGVAAGLDARTMIDVINVSTGRNSATLDKFPRLLGRTGASGEPAQNGLSHNLKDMELYLELCRSVGAPSFIGSTVTTLWRVVANQYGGDTSVSSLSGVLKVYEQWAGVEVRNPGAKGRLRPNQH
jgi:3-hydroxyisobutyrate dehydrogenase-like beta-hydroxyacid dehydrogenase